MALNNCQIHYYLHAFSCRKKNGEVHVFDESFNQENGINLPVKMC